MAYFKGLATSYGLLPASPSLDVSESFTWSAWVYPDITDDAPMFSWNALTGADFGGDHAYGPHIFLLQGSLIFRLKDTYTNELLVYIRSEVRFNPQTTIGIYIQNMGILCFSVVSCSI